MGNTFRESMQMTGRDIKRKWQEGFEKEGKREMELAGISTLRCYRRRLTVCKITRKQMGTFVKEANVEVVTNW